MDIACHALNIVLIAQILNRPMRLFAWAVLMELIYLLAEPASTALCLIAWAAAHQYATSAMRATSSIMANAPHVYPIVKYAQTQRTAKPANWTTTFKEIILAQHVQQTALFVPHRAVTNALLGSTTITVFALHVLLIASAVLQIIIARAASLDISSDKQANAASALRSAEHATYHLKFVRHVMWAIILILALSPAPFVHPGVLYVMKIKAVWFAMGLTHVCWMLLVPNISVKVALKIV